MKKTIIPLIALGCLIAGFYTRGLFVRTPIMNELHSVHYCSCIADNPEIQKEVFATVSKINDTLSKQTYEFASIHGISPFDFQTKIIIDENGNNNVIEWCSNRSRHVAGLRESYQDMTKKQIKLYDEAVEKAHELHIKNQAEQAAPSNH